jgi:hypothetical protein
VGAAESDRQSSASNPAAASAHAKWLAWIILTMPPALDCLSSWLLYLGAMLEIYIDADACPVKLESERVATRHGLHLHIVNSRGIPRVPTRTAF